MTSSDSQPDFPDEVPVADALEQTLPAVQPPVADEPIPDDGTAPLESNESDWQEQREVVSDFDEDEFR